MPTMEQGWSLDEKIPSDLDIAHGAIEKTMAAMEKLGWPGSDMFRVQMALEEAVVNAIEHGNQRDKNKKVHLVFEIDATKSKFEIFDEGSGFDHRNLADPRDADRLDKPRGRGVLLIQEFSTESFYNEKGNHLTIIKLRTPDSDGQQGV